MKQYVLYIHILFFKDVSELTSHKVELLENSHVTVPGLIDLINESANLTIVKLRENRNILCYQLLTLKFNIGIE